MAVACVEPLPLYRPRDPQASDLWRLLDQHFETFQQVYDERFAAKYGGAPARGSRPVVERSVRAFLKCGDLQEGFARVRCPDCHHEMFVARVPACGCCKQRCTCPSCHQKRALLTSIHVAEEICAPVAHRQVVLTIPKRLRLHARFDRKLLGKLCACAWTCLQAEVRRLLGRDDVVPGLIAAIQTFGELLHFHPHFHVLLTCGAFTPQGEFLELPELDLDRLQTAWQEAVFALYLGEGKIEPEVVENMRTWPHSGFSVDQFTQHIPPKGAHLIRYYGWYSNKARGLRRKQAEAAATASGEPAAPAPARSRASQTWAMLIQRVFEFDPLVCAKCGGTMKVVAFIEPPQGDVIEKILRHCGLWCRAAPRAPPPGDLRVYDPDGDSAASDEPRELTYVDIDTFEATC